MAFKVFSPEWIAAFESELQGDAEYTKAGKGWEGAVALHILADPDIGLAEDSWLLLDLHDGVCRSIKAVSPAEGEAAPYIISGRYPSWKQVLLKELGPVKGMMTGKLKLVKGSLGNITRYLKATQVIVESATRVDTEFLD